MSSMGRTCDCPPPVAPPFNPKEGPIEGSRKAEILEYPRAFKDIDKPIFMVVFPSPGGVGVIALTKTNFP